MKITLQLFGVFRDIEPSGAVSVHATLPMAAKDFKNLLINELLLKNQSTVDVRALIKSSALATDVKVLNDSDLITDLDAEKKSLALLPPVCGG